MTESQMPRVLATCCTMCLMLSCECFISIFTLLFMALHSQGIPMLFCQEDVYQCCGGHGVRGRLAHMMTKLNEL